MIHFLHYLVHRKVQVGLGTFEERFEQLKTTKNLSLISENVSNLVFEIRNDVKAAKGLRQSCSVVD